VFLLISNIFSEYKWVLWKFNPLPQTPQISQTDKQEIVEFLKKKFKIVNKKDWNLVTQEVTINWQQN
jgi:hypothetical protein